MSNTPKGGSSTLAFALLCLTVVMVAYELDKTNKRLAHLEATMMNTPVQTPCTDCAEKKKTARKPAAKAEPAA